MEDTTIFSPSFLLEHDLEVVMTVLDIYSSQTGLPAAIYKSDGLFWSMSRDRTFFTDLCGFLHKSRFKRYCNEDHLRRCKNASGDDIELCHMGLWNFAQPIVLNNSLIATLITGQRKIRDPERNKKSRDRFRQALLEMGVTKEERKQLRELFKKVPYIDTRSFHLGNIKKLSTISSSIFSIAMERERERNDKTRKIQLFAHEVKMPVQGTVSEVANLITAIDDYERRCQKSNSGDINEIKSLALKTLHRVKLISLVADNVISSITKRNPEPMKCQRKSLYRCLMESVEIFNELGMEKGIHILVPINLSKNYPFIEMVYEDMRRVFMNLLSNAYKYSFYGSATNKRFIKLYGEDVGNKYAITISNYGTGITRDEILSGKIYEEGYRGKLSSDRNRPGAGIGLTVAKRIIERHKGSLAITSEPKSMGNDEFSGSPYLNTVTVTLPFYQD